jgi:hypothetical protein
MTEDEARTKCADLTANDPNRFTHSWVPRESENGVWSIVKLAIPSPGSETRIATTEEDEVAIKSDPRQPIVKNAGPGGVGM